MVFADFCFLAIESRAPDRVEYLEWKRSQFPNGLLNAKINRAISRLQQERPDDCLRHIPL